MHKVMPSFLAIKLDLVNYNFYVIYSAILYAFMQLYRAFYKDFYVFSFKSFICKIAMAVLMAVLI